MEFYRIALYLVFGILPSLIWLFYYLQKDLHPEPKKMIVKIFLLGCLVTIPVYFLQVALAYALNQYQLLTFFGDYAFLFDVIKWFFIIAFIEEFFKFLVVKVGVFNSGQLDEPVDVMIYMVVAALGFAAVENTLFLLAPLNNISFNDIIGTTITITFIRFIGATFLHTLCSSLFGYYVAKSISGSKKSMGLLIVGLLFAAAFHGLYDFSIAFLETPYNNIIPIAIIMILCILMIRNFNRVKKIKSMCKI